MDTEKNTFNQKKIKKNERIIIGTMALADVFGCNRKWIEQLTKDGILEKEAKGTYDLLKCVNLYISHLKSRTGATEDSKKLENDKAAEELKLKRIKAEKAELELRKIKGELHESRDVEQAVLSMIIAAKSKLDAIPSKLAPQLVNVSEADYIFEKIDEEIKRAENELSEYDVGHKEVIEDGTS